MSLSSLCSSVQFKAEACEPQDGARRTPASWTDQSKRFSEQQNYTTEADLPGRFIFPEIRSKGDLRYSDWLG